MVLRKLLLPQQMQTRNQLHRTTKTRNKNPKQKPNPKTPTLPLASLLPHNRRRMERNFSVKSKVKVDKQMGKNKGKIKRIIYCKAEFPCEFKFLRRSTYKENGRRCYFVFCRWSETCNQQSFEPVKVMKWKSRRVERK